MFFPFLQRNSSDLCLGGSLGGTADSGTGYPESKSFTLFTLLTLMYLIISILQYICFSCEL